MAEHCNSIIPSRLQCVQYLVQMWERNFQKIWKQSPGQTEQNKGLSKKGQVICLLVFEHEKIDIYTRENRCTVRTTTVMSIIYLAIDVKYELGSNE